MTRPPLRAAVYFLALPLVCGCTAGVAQRKRAEALDAKIARLEPAARRCSEEDLAVAKANVAFALLEWEQGAYFRANEHLDLAHVAYRSAELESRSPACQGSGDQDGDGLPDEKDQCPTAAEDKDGDADQDGCPEDGDRDGDGIVDSRDQCPTQPEDKDGVDDLDGCPDVSSDRDADGIVDEADQCIDNPEDKDGFEDEDGCPDLDNDRDTLPDLVDKCPMHAEDVDTFEDADGCPDPDNDQDRVADITDQCPNQAEDYDGDADQDGCPDLYKSIIIRDDRIELKQTVYFATGKDRILSKSFALLNEVALALRDNATLNLRIEGHTDSQGGTKPNLILSRKRAESVRRYLIDQAISPDRLTAVGHGEDKPLEDNRTEEGRSANRRVEFHIVKK